MMLSRVYIPLWRHEVVLELSSVFLNISFTFFLFNMNNTISVYNKIFEISFFNCG